MFSATRRFGLILYVLAQISDSHISLRRFVPFSGKGNLGDEILKQAMFATIGVSSSPYWLLPPEALVAEMALKQVLGTHRPSEGKRPIFFWVPLSLFNRGSISLFSVAGGMGCFYWSSLGSRPSPT